MLMGKVSKECTGRSSCTSKVSLYTESTHVINVRVVLITPFPNAMFLHKILCRNS